MQKLLLGYRDDMRVEVERGKAITDFRAVPLWPPGLRLNIHVDLEDETNVLKSAAIGR